MSQAWSVDEIVRVPAVGGGYRVWRVTGVFLGGECQEDVIELETLDRTPNTQGRMCVPRELLNSVAAAPPPAPLRRIVGDPPPGFTMFSEAYAAGAWPPPAPAPPSGQRLSPCR